MKTRLLRGLLALLTLVFWAPSLPAGEPDVRLEPTVVAIQKVLPSVVNIATETVIEYHDWYEEIWRNFYGLGSGRPHQAKSFSLGSGVIIDADGYVLTNFHVVRRATRIQVKLWDGRTYDADPWLTSEASDIAVLKLRTKPGEKFKPIHFAANDDLLLGETVLALGDPFGLGGSVTKGILSSKNRRPSSGDEPLEVEDWLQTDAAINPGNSGGPLVDLRGDLIGLNVAVYREQDGQRGMGIGFAIPVKQVNAALARYSVPEMTDSLWFGAQFKTGPGPLRVGVLQPGSPAARAGLRLGDEVLQVNGEPTRNLIMCNRLLCGGDDHKARLLVRRDGRHLTLQVQLMPLEDFIRQRLGLVLLGLPAQTAARLGLTSGQALYIDQVDKGSPADQAQLQRGYVLTGFEDQNSISLRNLADVLGRKAPGDVLKVNLIAPQRIGGGFVEFQQGTVPVKLR